MTETPLHLYIPHEIKVNSEFFGTTEGPLVGRVLLIFRDSTGDQHCAFEIADMGGVFVIHLGSTFFLGWA